MSGLLILLNLFLALVAWKKDYLTFQASLMAFIFAIVLVVKHEIYIYILLCFFYGSAILVDKILNFICGKPKQLKECRKTNQIVAILFPLTCGLLLYWMTHRQFYYIVSITVISGSLCDTIASAVGSAKKRVTYDIITFRRVTTGISGGITVIGTIFGISASIWLVVFVHMTEGIHTHIGLWGLLYICCISILSMFLDSILGSLFQVKYRCQVCGKISDHKECCNQTGIQCNRTGFLSNTGVNFCTNMIVIMLQIIGYIGVK